MKTHNLQKSKTDRSVNVKAMTASTYSTLSVTKNQFTIQEKNVLQVPENNKHMRRYSIDDNGGGYLGL